MEQLATPRMQRLPGLRWLVLPSVGDSKKKPGGKVAPADLEKQLRRILIEAPELSWDEALIRIAESR